MSDAKLLSVIVPIYKVEAYLPRCVESLKRQTYPNLEIILVDDGSPDKCPELCDAFAADDARIKVVHKPNGGLSDARNAGMKVANGEYIAFLDSDDYIHHRMYEILIHELEERGADLAECDYVKVPGTVEEEEYKNCNVTEADTLQALTDLMDWTLFDISVWNKVYKRELVDGLEFPFGKINEDEFWTYKVISRAKKCLHIHFPMHYYQQAREGSILTNKFSERNFDSTEAMMERVPYIAEHFPQLLPAARRSILFHIYFHWRRFLLFDPRPESEWIGYFERFVDLYKSLPQEYFDDYCRGSKVKTYKVKMTNKYLAKSTKLFMKRFGFSQKVIFKLKCFLHPSRKQELIGW